MAALSEKLKFFRKKSHLTQQQVADTLGVKRSTYAYYETGTTMPKLHTLQSIARLYNTNVDLLLGNISADSEQLVSSPDKFENWYMDERFDQLSDFEQSILLRIRLMNASDKKKLLAYLDSCSDNDL